MSSTKTPPAPVQIPPKTLRSFGFLVGGVFAAISVFPMIFRGAEIRHWALIVAGCLVIPAALYPSVLAPVFKIWMKIGHVLGVINNRIILGVVFYGIMTPLGNLMRLMKKDPLEKSFDSHKTTYRVSSHNRTGSHMNKQF